jgi:ATP-dependent Clp protease ATP-binding subunit ClpC
VGVFARYTEQARRAVFFARYEAGRRGSSAISPGHLLLGLGREKDSIPNRLVSLKEKLPDLCARIGIPFELSVPGQADKKVELPLTQDSKQALGYATQEADSDMSSRIETDHLLRGLLRFPNEASEALRAVGIDIESVRLASRQLRRERATVYGRIGQVASFLWRILRPPLAALGIMAAVGLLVVLIVRLLNQ